MIRRGAAALVVLSLLAASCRTARPAGAPLAPLTATDGEGAMRQLRERREAFRGVKSLMRIRVTAKGQTQSLRAMLTVEDARKMTLVAFTPVGTTAMSIAADGAQVSVKNNLDHSEWEGTAADLGRSLGLFGSELLPAEMAMLITGLPPRDDLDYEVTPAGLASASVDGLTATFDPAAYPAKHVVVTRGADRIEIEHLEIVE